jgi:hypothetical protein
MTWFEIYALLAPLQIVLGALLVVWITGWQDKREDRRRAQQSDAHRSGSAST